MPLKDWNNSNNGERLELLRRIVGQLIRELFHEGVLPEQRAKRVLRLLNAPKRDISRKGFGERPDSDIDN